ncbi:MAG: D-tyrosyl-tRNA(Tyr) deacylase [Clostridiaceae bacterium]|nr:D-tyrosyl-tRNA(Tyr) deacylase [Clostridiaceae bacterium]
MIAVIQRVKESYVKIDGIIVSNINKGLNVMLCVTLEDTKEDIIYIADKIVKMRIFPDSNDKMNLSLIDIKGDILVISQFTLAADTKKGNRPSFINAAKPQKADEYYNQFISYIKNTYSIDVKTGSFGAQMHVGILNDGPVTIIIDSKENRIKKY